MRKIIHKQDPHIVEAVKFTGDNIEDLYNLDSNITDMVISKGKNDSYLVEFLYMSSNFGEDYYAQGFGVIKVGEYIVFDGISLVSYSEDNLAKDFMEVREIV